MNVHRMLIVWAIFAVGCSRVPCADDGSVTCIVEERINSAVEWRHGCCQDQQICAFIEQAVARELCADTAIQVALLNNPKIQALYEELGIALAGWVEAGLLTNPSFEIEVRYPHIRGLQTNIEYLITSALLDLFLVPLRTCLAATEFEQTKLRVSHAILDLAFDVRETYNTLLTEREKVRYLETVADLTDLVAEIHTRQAAVGNINDLELQIAQAALLQAQLDLLESQTEVVRLSERLNRLLGFECAVCIQFPDSVQWPVEGESWNLCALETMALEERLDVQVARWDLARICQMLGLKQWWTYTNIQAGLAGEKDPDGANVLGPGFAGEIPIFNYGQAARMRLCAELERARALLAELEIRVRSEVREAYTLFVRYRHIVEDYRSHLLPKYSSIVESSEAYYNVMGLGVDKLLEHKRQEAVAFTHYLEQQQRYLSARVALDRALGGYLAHYVTEEAVCD